jgi:striatin 1/3/4
VRKVRGGKEPAIPVPTSDIVSYDYKPKHEVSVHLDCVRAVCFYDSHPVVVSGSDDGTIRVTHLEAKVTVSRKTVRRVQNISSLRGHGGPVLCLSAFEREEKQMLLSGGADSVICLWALPDPQSALYEPHGILTHHRVSEIRVHGDAVWSVDVFEDLRTGLSASADGTAKVWQIDSGEAAAVAVGDVPVSVKALSGRQFAIGGRSGTVRLFDDANCQTAVIAAGEAPILKIQFLADAGQILALCDDNVVRVVDIQGEAVANELDGHENGMSGICVTPDGEFVITAGNDASVNVWRVGAFVRVDNVKLHSTKFGEGALCCASAPAKTGKFCFATGGAEGTVHVFVKG